MALPQARPNGDNSLQVKITAAAALVPGQVTSAYGGLAGVVLGCENKAIGDYAVLALDGMWDIDIASGTTASAGDDAFFNTSTGLIVTAGGSSIIHVGTFAIASASGETKARIHLNGTDGASFANYIPAAAQQAMTTAGAVGVTQFYTAVNTTTGSGHASTLADGVVLGQLKKVQLIVDGGDLVLTPATLSGGTTITFADAGDYALLKWTSSGWVAIELGNDADGATAPVVA